MILTMRQFKVRWLSWSCYTVCKILKNIFTINYFISVKVTLGTRAVPAVVSLAIKEVLCRSRRNTLYLHSRQLHCLRRWIKSLSPWFSQLGYQGHSSDPPSPIYTLSSSNFSSLCKQYKHFVRTQISRLLNSFHRGEEQGDRLGCGRVFRFSTLSISTRLSTV